MESLLWARWLSMDWELQWAHSSCTFTSNAWESLAPGWQDGMVFENSCFRQLTINAYHAPCSPLWSGGIRRTLPLMLRLGLRSLEWYDAQEQQHTAGSTLLDEHDPCQKSPWPHPLPCVPLLCQSATSDPRRHKSERLPSMTQVYKPRSGSSSTACSCLSA